MLGGLGHSITGRKEKWSKTTVTSILQNEKYKGDALLQKSFTVDFLEKKMKSNEGEVPQYYVEGSHPAIVDPDEWDHVQTEFTRRKALGRAYSGKSVLSAKLVCEDCGGFFGSKVWHSTDRYRRTIWQCNSKFKGEERCHTPTVDTETVQRLFIQAYNRMMENQEQIIKDCETMRRALTDFAALDAEIERQLEETQVVAELVKVAVKENASTAQSQEAYLKSTKPSPGVTKKPLRNWSGYRICVLRKVRETRQCHSTSVPSKNSRWSCVSGATPSGR